MRPILLLLMLSLSLAACRMDPGGEMPAPPPRAAPAGPRPPSVDQARQAAAVEPPPPPEPSPADLLERALDQELSGQEAAAVETYLAVLPADPPAAVEGLRRLSTGRLWVAADGSGDVPGLDQALAVAPPMATIELAPGTYQLGATIDRPVRLLAAGGPTGRVWPADVVLVGRDGRPPTVSAPFVILDGIQLHGDGEGPALVLAPGARLDLLDVELHGDLLASGAELVVDGGRVERGSVRLGEGAALEASFWRLAGASGPALTLEAGARAQLLRPALGGAASGCLVGAGAELTVEGGSLVGVEGDGVVVQTGGRATLVNLRLQEGGGAALRLGPGAWARLERCRLRDFPELLALDPTATLEQLDNVLRFR